MVAYIIALALSLPNPTLTPGAVRPLTVTQICSTLWGRDRRHVTRTVKRQVIAAYGVPNPSCCVIDHLVPRELGGADDVTNLWPQPLKDARRKDTEENFYHQSVCRGRMTLNEAQDYFKRWGR